MLDEMSGERKSGGANGHRRASPNLCMSGANTERTMINGRQPDTGSASRFFYCAKASRSEREMGLDELDSVQRVCYNETIPLEQGEGSLWESTGLIQSIRAAGDTQQARDTIVSAFGTLPPKVADLCLLMCTSGRRPTGRFLMALRSTTSTATNRTIASTICDWLDTWSTSDCTKAANSATGNGGSRVTTVVSSSQLLLNTGISISEDTPCMDGVSLATSSELSPTSALEKLEEECSKKPAHETVKPLALMRYLCRLITPPGGVILDPFLGSGSSGCAATLEGFAFVGIEREAEYLAIAEKRIAYWQSKAAMPLFEAEPLADPDPAPPPPAAPRMF